MIQWQKQWSAMTAATHDAHLLWLFHGACVVGGKGSVSSGNTRSVTHSGRAGAGPDIWTRERIPTSPYDLRHGVAT